MRRSRRYIALIYLFLTIITAAVFSSVPQNEFLNLEDSQYIADNPYIRTGLTAASLKWALTAVPWHPIAWISHLVDVALFGMNSGAHHSINLIIHILNVLLLFAVLRKCTGDIWPSAFIAGLFAIHPLQVESVAWLAQRKNLLGAFFFLLALLAYRRYCRGPEWKRYLPILIIFIFGLLSSPIVMALPLALLLFDFWPLERTHGIIQQTSIRLRSSKRSIPEFSLPYLIMEKIPLFALALIAGVITYLMQHKSDVLSWSAHLPLKIRIVNAFVSYTTGIQKSFWPNALAPFYPNPDGHASLAFTFGMAMALLIITILIILRNKTHKYLFVGWFWHLALLAPLLGFFQIGEPSYADRHSYLAVIGLAIMAAWLVPQWIGERRFRTPALAFAAIAALASLSAAAYRQQHYWRNNISLFKHALKLSQDNYQAHYHMAETLREKGRLREAIYHNEQCLRIRPDHFEALNGMGLALVDSGFLDKAIEQFKAAARTSPERYPAYLNWGLTLSRKGNNEEAISIYRGIIHKFNTPQIHLFLADALKTQGLKEEAIKEYKTYTTEYPFNPNAQVSLGLLLAEKGRHDEAAMHFRNALAVAPQFLAAHTNLAYMLARQGRLDDAIFHYLAALGSAPRTPDLLINLGNAYSRKGDFNSAAAEYKTALKIQPDNFIAHTYLGAALFRLGRTDEACDHLNRAVEINPEFAEAKNYLQSIKNLK